MPLLRDLRLAPKLLLALSEQIDSRILHLRAEGGYGL